MNAESAFSPWELLLTAWSVWVFAFMLYYHFARMRRAVNEARYQLVSRMMTVWMLVFGAIFVLFASGAPIALGVLASIAGAGATVWYWARCARRKDLPDHMQR